MILSQVLKVSSVAITTTFTLAAMANNAQALDFSFSDVSGGTYSISGTFRIDDTITPPKDPLVQSDFQDWVISIDDGTTVTQLFGDAGGFGTDNSDITDFPATGISLVSNTELRFNNTGLGNAFCISQGNNCTFTPTQNAFGTNVLGIPTTYVSTLPSVGDGGIEFATSLPLDTVVAVPFEVSPNLAIIVLGGIWGISRLPKRRKDSKLIN